MVQLPLSEFTGSRQENVHALASCKLPHSTTFFADTISGQAPVTLSILSHLENTFFNTKDKGLPLQ